MLYDFEIAGERLQVDTTDINYEKVWSRLSLSPAERKTAERIVNSFEPKGKEKLDSGINYKSRSELENIAAHIFVQEKTQPNPNLCQPFSEVCIRSTIRRNVIDKLIDSGILKRIGVDQGEISKPGFYLDVKELYRASNGYFS